MIYFGILVHNWRKDRHIDQFNDRVAIRLGFATHSSCYYYCHCCCYCGCCYCYDHLHNRQNSSSVSAAVL